MNIIARRLKKYACTYVFQGDPPDIGIVKCFPFESEGKHYDGYVCTDEILTPEQLQKYNLLEEKGQLWFDRCMAESDYDEANPDTYVQDIIDTVEKQGYAIYTSGGTNGVIYAPSSRGGYQATYFSKNGFIGHEAEPTLEKTIERFTRSISNTYRKPITEEEFNEIAKHWDDQSMRNHVGKLLKAWKKQCKNDVKNT